MNRRELLASAAVVLAAPKSFGTAFAAGLPPVGAEMAWTSYQAEAMKTTGSVMGPAYGPFKIENEASHQTCVKLTGSQQLEFTVEAAANTMVIRYCLPDAPDGSGVADSLALYRNGEKIGDIALTSRFAWLYGNYPFTNTPADGKPRHFFDDVRVKGLALKPGDVIKLVKTGSAEFAVIDLVDLELAPAPLAKPQGALSLSDFGADGKGVHDDTEALRKLIAEAARQQKIAYVPPGDYKLTGDIELPSGVTLQGAGMWHTTFTADEALYPQAGRRLRFKLTGTNSHLADFALDGKLKYRNDSEQNDGIFGAGGRDCTVKRLWIEHTKVGMWFYVCSGMHIEGCRMRNTFADGINLCVDTRDCVIENCSARNTGDDCFAIWPAPSDQGFSQKAAAPGNNVIRRCTGQLPFLAQGGSIYGGANNRMEDCLFTDIGSGCGILISSTFPTTDTAYDNNFSGTTVVKNCKIVRCGGYDHGWTWRAAFQICLERKDIAGLAVSDVEIEDSFSDGLGVIVAPQAGVRSLSDARFERLSIKNSARAASGRYDVVIGPHARGAITFEQSHFASLHTDSPELVITRR